MMQHFRVQRNQLDDIKIRAVIKLDPGAVKAKQRPIRVHRRIMGESGQLRPWSPAVSNPNICVLESSTA